MNGIGGTTIAVIAVALACITAILVLAGFAAFGRRRRLLRNRRYRHHVRIKFLKKFYEKFKFSKIMEVMEPAAIKDVILVLHL